MDKHFYLDDGPPPILPEEDKKEKNDISKSKADNKLAAGLCGIFLGAFGVHKFVLGFNGPGLIMLLVSLLTCVGWPIMSIIGMIEGIYI